MAWATMRRRASLAALGGSENAEAGGARKQRARGAHARPPISARSSAPLRATPAPLPVPARGKPMARLAAPERPPG